MSSRGRPPRSSSHFSNQSGHRNEDFSHVNRNENPRGGSSSSNRARYQKRGSYSHRGGSVSSERGNFGGSSQDHCRSEARNNFQGHQANYFGANSSSSSSQIPSLFERNAFERNDTNPSFGNNSNSSLQRNDPFPRQESSSNIGPSHSAFRGHARPNFQRGGIRNPRRFENPADILNHLRNASVSQLVQEGNDPRSSLRRFLSSHSICTNEQLVELFSLFHKISLDETSPEMSSQFFIELVPSSFIAKTFFDFVTFDFPTAATRLSNFSEFILQLLDVLIACFIRCSALSHQHILPSIIILERQIQDLNIRHPALLTQYVKERLKRLTALKEAASVQRAANTEEATQMTRKEQRLLKQDAALPPDDYRRLAVFPTIEDIQKDTKDVFIRRNLVRGAYDSVETYLDIHFRLMREDFVEPLRDGIKQYLQVITNAQERQNGGKRREKFDLRVYPNVRVNSSFPSRECGIVHDLKFDSENLKRVVWEKTKRLSYGSLVCLSQDDFRTMYFGVIVLREVDDLRKGIVTVKFHENAPPAMGNYVMAESNVFFEAYRHTLTRLKELRAENFPMPDLLLGKFMTTDVRPSLPEYFRRDATIFLDLSVFASASEVRMRGGEKKFHVYPLVKNEWPSHEDLMMDSSQFTAFKHALTRNLSIIQGPPGCGKTYVGLKIVQTLLDVCSIADLGPILIVCYTNHALDQFLEGMLPFCSDGIVRVGRQCKSVELEKFNINALRGKRSGFQGGAAANLYRQLNETEEQINRLQHCVVKAQTAVLTLNDLQNVIPAVLQEQLRKCATNASKALTNWLLGIDSMEDDFETDLTTIASNDVLECLLLQEVLNEVETIVDEFRYNLEELENELVQVDDNFEEELRDVFGQQREISEARKKTRNHSDMYSAIFPDFESATGWCIVQSRKSLTNLIRRRLRGNMMEENVAAFTDNVTILGIDDRWRLYNYWRSEYLRGIANRSRQNEEEYERLVLQYQEIRQLQDMEIFRKAKIIGLTTTGAARYGRILCELQPRIVIVEEAAEVLESHIVTSLSQGTQHLILIGDHKQLQPNNAVYRLAKEYKLNVSLFERLIECKYPFDTLALQHRMRPEISVLMKHIYENLGNHPCVEKYEHIRGMKKDVFLMNHNNPESFNDECSSYSNGFEASLIAGLCRNLLLNGYKPSQITVLTLYSGQLFTIQRQMPKKDFNGVRITVVDNFQGEENDIILLSLVRSNDNDKIGFLEKENRICVALSRARMGLYVIGNFDLMSGRSSLWNKVVDDMRSLDCCGDVLQLACQMHPDDPPIDIRVAKDFLKAPEGGCSKICNDRLICGHACRRICHPMDREHKEYKCLQPCAKSCPKNGHPCKRACYEDCGKCLVKVPVILPDCGHEQYAECFRDSASVKCSHLCEKRLPACQHKCKKKCGDPCTTDCRSNVQVTLPYCGHTVLIDCYLSRGDLWSVLCPRPCEMTLECGHTCKGSCGTCANGRLHEPCLEKTKRTLVCGHEWGARCFEENTSSCPKPCQDSCIHNVCRRRCGDPCDLCNEVCSNLCEHRSCSKLCSEPCDVGPCNEPCLETFTCKKCQKIVSCVGLCTENCPQKCRNCDSEELCDIFFGTEEEPNARYLLLPKCRHIVEVAGMDEYIKTLCDGESIQSITCPRCKHPITKLCTKRYLEQVKRCQNLRNIVIRKDLDNNKLVKAKSLHIDWSSFQEKICLLYSTFGMKNGAEFCESNLQTINNPLTSPRDLLYCRSLLDCLQQIRDIHKSMTDACKLSERNKKSVLQLHLNRSFILLLRFVVEKNRRFGGITVSTYEMEMNRLECLIACLHFEKALTGEAEAVEALKTEVESLFHITSKQDSHITKEKKKLFLARLEKMKAKYHLPGLGITPRERDEIVKVLGLSKGHWFKCPNGHVYAIGDCGGATERSKCPECGLVIGGVNHQLDPSNQLASEMDGAQHPAFSVFNYNANLDAVRRMQAGLL